MSLLLRVVAPIRLTILLLIAALMSLLPVAHAADAIGRIFFTPAQRAQLDLARTQKIVVTQTKDEPIPEFVTYSGIVRHSDGKATVWVNNKAMSDAELSTAQPLTGRIDRSGRILLQAPQASGAGQLQLKVGQSAELLSGRVDEAYAVPRATPAAKAVPQAKPETANKTAAPAQTRPPAADSGNETPNSEALRKAAP